MDSTAGEVRAENALLGDPPTPDSLEPEDDAQIHSPSSGKPQTQQYGGCGFGCIKLSRLDKFASAKMFIVLYFAFAFLNGFQNSYTVAVLTTLERRFDLPSSLSGMLVTTSTIGFAATTLFVSHFGRRGDIAKIFAGCTFLTVLCAFLYVIPHWLYGTGNDDIDSRDDHLLHARLSAERSYPNKSIELLTLHSYGTAGVYQLPTQHCTESDIAMDSNSTLEEGICKKQVGLENGRASVSLVTFSLFVTSEVLQGLAGSPIWSLGIEFLDNVAGSELGSKLIGMMYMVRFISPTVSFILGAWFLSIYANLKESALTQEHPRWVGAWWLGFLVSAVCALLIFFPMIMLPKNMKPIKRKKSTKEEIHMSTESNSERQENADFKAMLRSISRLIKNPIYSLTMMGIVADVLMVGYVIFVPKYLEVQFQMTSAMANLFGGMIPALCGGLSSLTSGYISARIGTGKLSKLCRFTCIFSGVTAIIAVPILLVGCNQLKLAGSIQDHSLNVDTACNRNCSCSVNTFDPVCGSDNILYYSPCHAGCPADDKNMTLGSCNCVDGGAGYRGMCETDCAWSLVIYLGSFYAVVFLANIYNVPATNTMLRSVNTEDKSMAMGFLTFFMSFIVFPAPILYGKAIDSACLIHRPTPQSACAAAEHVLGACLLYDRADFRHKFHVIFLGLKLVSTVLYIFPWFLAHRGEANEGTSTLCESDTVGNTTSNEKGSAWSINTINFMNSKEASIV